MATFWSGSAFTTDYGNTGNLRIQPGYGMLNKAIDRAVMAQFDDVDPSPCLNMEDVLMHCGYLECHHDLMLHDFDVQP